VGFKGVAVLIREIIATYALKEARRL